MNGAINWAAKWTVIVVAGLGVLAAPAVAAETGVTVIRGTTIGTAAGQAAAGLPTVLRGWPPGAPRRAPKPEPKRDAPGWIATGGETLWLVERDGGRVVGCWLQGSTQVGEIDILCGRGALR